MKIVAAIKMRFVIWVWNHTPHCDEMSRLASRSLDGTLPRKLRLKMRVHFFICVWCQRYGQQLRMMHQRAHGLDETRTTSQTLSGDAKERMKLRLRKSSDA
ncbi:MAG: hypothetical protein JWR19_4054 [Pedosphaera sp.]|nr:hypothetical protein [Pedosphaera sp.]